jgi:hypothetical protein
MQSVVAQPPHPLAGYQLARYERHRYLIMKEVGATKSYFVGFGRFTTERDAAIRYHSPPRAILANCPGTKCELA